MKLDDLKLLRKLLFKFNDDYIHLDCDNCDGYSLVDVYGMLDELICKEEKL